MMSAYRSNSPRAQYFSGLILLLLLLPMIAFAGQKKTAPAPEVKPADQRIKAYFDISKIVWPGPPAIARIRFMDIYTGEKVDPDLFNKKKEEKKQKWMDRLAGTKPLADQYDLSKLPFQLIRTYGVAVDSKGNIYAGDQGVGAVFIFNPETKGVELIKNRKDANFGLINGLAIDDSDRLFVTDSKLREVLVFNPQHQQEGAFGGDVLANPGGLAIDNENRFLYVVDTGNDVVDVFDADTFKLLRKIGTPGKRHTLTDPGTFSLPSNVAVDNDGNVYVVDSFNARIEIFDADGGFISMFGKLSDAPGFFERPKGIAIDSDGHIWVVDAAQDRVKVFDRDGQLLIYFGEHGAYPGQFQGLYGITIDNKNNRVVTSENWPGRVQVFRYVTDAEFEKATKEKEQAGTRVTAEQKKSEQPAPAQSSAAH
ncbi:MAG: SMP-30/gluconolactonase/LRE family protein [Terriglobales bacterium]|jgi:DNA-binding beta-propeller fold protein YncE